MAGAHRFSSGSEELVRELTEPLVENGSGSARSTADLVRPPAGDLPQADPARRPDVRPVGLQPRVLIALVLMVAGIVWAIVRGLEGYGLGTMNVIYDLDQPPLLLVLVGAWLWYRSRRR